MKPIALYMHHFGPFMEEQIDFTRLDKELFFDYRPHRQWENYHF